MKAQPPGSILLPLGLQQMTGSERVVVYQPRPQLPSSFRRVEMDAPKTPAHSRQPSVDRLDRVAERPRPDSMALPPHLLKPPSLESVKEPEPMPEPNPSLASVYSFPSGTPLQHSPRDKPLPELPVEPRHYRVKKLALRALQPVLGPKLTYRLFKPLRPLIDAT